MKIRKGDKVKMIKGKDRGKVGKVIKVFPRENKVIVEGLNLVKKHLKPRREGQKGEIVSLPRKVPASNVMLVCPHCHQATRVGYRLLAEGKKVRICKKCQEEI